MTRIIPLNGHSNKTTSSDTSVHHSTLTREASPCSGRELTQRPIWYSERETESDCRVFSPKLDVRIIPQGPGIYSKEVIETFEVLGCWMMTSRKCWFGAQQGKCTYEFTTTEIRISAWRRASGHEAPLLGEELLSFNCYWGRESQFSPVELLLVS